MMVRVLGAVAELELALITERLGSGKAASAEADRWAGGIVLFGFRTERSDDLGGNVLVVNDTEAAIIKHAVSKRAQAPAGMRSCATSQPTQRGAGAANGRAPTCRTSYVTSNCAGLGPLDTSEWLLAQDVCGAKKTTAGNPADRLTHGHSTTASRLLSGVATCDGCGTKLRVQRDDRWAAAASYVCKNPACTSKARISAKQLEAHVTEQWLASNADRAESPVVAQDELHAEQRAELVAAIKAERARLAKLDAADMLAAVQRIAELEADVAKLADLPRGVLQAVSTGRTMGQAFTEDGLDA